MSYGRSYKRKTKRKTKRKGRKRYPLYSMGTPSGIPTIRRASLRYCDEVLITSTGGLLNTNQKFLANGLFDCNVALGGHQPMGFDTWASLYNRYVVLGSKIRCEVALTDVGNDGGMYAGIFLDDDSSVTYGSLTGLVEARKGNHVTCTNQRAPQYTSSKYSARAFHNITDIKDNMYTIGAPVTADPTDKAYYVIWGESIKTAQSNSYTALVIIDYIVEFSEPKDLAQS